MTPDLVNELPIAALPGDPAWGENFCFTGYDRHRKVGFWLHCARWQHDRTIWREQLLIYLPDSSYAIHRGWGRRPSDRGPASALLDFKCISPGKAWQVRYHGPAQRTTNDELQGGAIREGLQALLELELDFTSAVPIWDMRKGLRSAEVGHMHIEQTGAVKGSVAFDGEQIAMEGFGWHDHSQGRRDLTNMLRHCWIHGNLSRGRSFALTMVENREKVDGQTLSLNRAIIWENGQIFEAHCPNPPALDSTAIPPSKYSFMLEYAGGTIEIAAELFGEMVISCDRKMECLHGVAPDQGIQATYEQGTVFTVDGECFEGHTERSYQF